MSTNYSNRIATAAANAVEYRQSLLSLVGTRDPIALLASHCASLERLVATVRPDLLEVPECPGKWSIAEVIRHPADVEIVYAFRYRLTIAQEDPLLPGFDQDAWTQRCRYSASDAGQSLADLRALRSMNLRVLEPLAPSDWTRRGVHAERGPETMDEMVRIAAAHDEIHVRQIRRIQNTLARARES